MLFLKNRKVENKVKVLKKISVTKLFKFESAHQLPYYKGSCHDLHGHSYSLSVTVSGKLIEDTKNPSCGMIIDFKDLKSIVNECVIKRMDHKYLNDIYDNPTAELMVRGIYKDIQSKLPKDITLVKCKLWETDSSCAEYSEEIIEE